MFTCNNIEHDNDNLFQYRFRYSSYAYDDLHVSFEILNCAYNLSKSMNATNYVIWLYYLR